MKKNKALTVGLIVLLGLGVLIFYGVKKQSKGSAESYREVAVQRSDLEVTILSTGTVQPQNRLEIKPPVAGRIERVLVKEGQKVRVGQILAWMSSTERAALLDAARSQGADEIKKWEELYKPTPILAPLSGIVILKNVEPGQTFTTTDAVFVLSDRLTVKAQVDETDIAEIKVKQTAVVTLDAYPDQKIPAVVDQIAFEAKTVSNVTTYIVDVVPDSEPEFMRSGMTANIKFFVKSKSQALVIPTEALKIKDSKKIVLLKNPESKMPREQVVETGLTDGKKLEVISGVSEGDIILLSDVKIPAAGGNKNGGNPFGMPAPPGKSNRGSSPAAHGSGK